MTSSNLDSGKKLSKVNSILLSVLGVDKELAAEHWEDGPILITLSLQLIGTFLLLFSLQSAAFYVLSKVVWVALPMGFLSAFLIISADRILISGDWYLEGEYWHIYHKNPQSPELSKISKKRWAKMGVRYIIGIIISVSIVTIATPALFSLEIQTELDKKNFYEENKDAVFDIGEKAKAKENDYVNAKSFQEALKKELDQKIIHLSKLQNSSIDDPIVKQFQSQLSNLRNKLRALKDDYRDAKDRESRERLGIKSNIETKDGISDSGIKGCGDNCVYWQNKAGQLESDIESIENQIQVVDGQLTDQEFKVNFRSTNEITKLEEDVERIKQQYIVAQKNTETARGEWSNYKDNRLAKVGKEDGVGISFEKAGLKRVVDEYDELLSDASISTNTMLWLLKIFAVFLETIVFTSKIFGTSRNYSCALYERHKAKWA